MKTFERNKDYYALADALEAKGLTVKKRNTQCPWHEDKSPSASIHEDDDGAWRVFCHVCKKRGDVYDITGEKPEDIKADDRRRAAPPQKDPPKRLPDVSAIKAAYPNSEDWYEYTDPATGKVDMLISRYRNSAGKKSFSQWSPDGEGWHNTACPKPWPLFNRTLVRDAVTVVVVEGEKCVKALRVAGIVATTSPCGAGKSEHADWQPLAGKTVYLWPDNDDTGIKHMREVQAQLERITPTPSLHWIDPAMLTLPAKGDAADLCAGLASVEIQHQAVLDVLADAKPIGAAKEVEGLLRAMIAGTYKPVDWPWPKLSGASKALMPGTVTLICGDPGATKSFMLLEAMAYWHRNDIPVALFELEEDRRYHLHRCLAQQAHESRLLDSSWAMSNADLAIALYQQNAAFLNGFGSRIWEAPDKQVTLDELTQWVELRSKEGARVIAIDPVTAAAQGDKPWIADQKFIMAVKTIVREHQNSLVLVTHPTKGVKGKGPGQVSGGAAYMRFAQSALWLSTKEGHPNRELHITKARNGRGNGLCIDYNFSGATLCFEELSVSVPEEPAPKTPHPTWNKDPSPNEDLFA